MINTCDGPLVLVLSAWSQRSILLSRNPIALLLLLLLCSCNAPAQADPALTRSLHEAVRELIHKQQIAGMAVAVMNRGEPLFQACYGYADLEHKIAVRPQSVFALASVTKIFTCLAMLKLAEQKQVKLNDLVVDRARKFPKAWSDVRIVNLLSHTAGLPTTTRESTPWNGSYSELLARRRAFLAGERAEYNNIGYIIAGKIIEQTSNTKLANFLRDNVFTPAGMKHTRIPSELFPPDLAIGYRQEKNHLVTYKNYHPWTEMGGSAGVISSLEDLIRFEKSLTGETLLNHSTFALMLQPVPLKNGAPSGWSCGWEMTNSPEGIIYTKNGNIGGYSSWYSRGVQEGISIIILSNTGQVKFAQLDARMRQLIRKHHR